MRLAVWNMSHWSRSDADRAAAWQYLADLGADVALVQEAVPPTDSRAIYRPIGGNRRWGSAVVGLTVEVDEVLECAPRSGRRRPITHTFPGAVAIATVQAASGPLSLVSMYGVIDDGYAVTSVNHQLSDLTPLFDSSHAARIVVAGDLNLTTQWVGADRRYLPWHRTTLQRVREFGLLDAIDMFRADGPLDGCGCADGAECRHVRTQYHPRSSRPWQNDYVFVSSQLAPTLTAVDIVDDEPHRHLSEHLPIVVDLT